MKKSFLVALIIFFSWVNLNALEVDIDEIMKAKKIKFLNYTGKPKKVESINEIKAIGRQLASKIRRVGDNRRVRFFMKYSIIHAVSNKEKDKFSADIFSIDKNAKVDHIENVRRIIRGYLENRYNYSESDARTLALFVTYYNAIYRSNLEYFQSKYKKVVMNKINAKNAGISTKYFEWPGLSKIIIPLTLESKRGKIGKIDPNLISDKAVRTAVRKEDKNIAERKNMVKIKEKKIIEDKEKLKEKKVSLTTKKKNLQKEKMEIEKEKKKIAEAKGEIKKQKVDAKKTKDKKIRAIKEKNIKKKEKAVVTKEKQIAEKEKEIKKEQRDIAEEEKSVKTTEKKIAEKEKDLREDKSEIKDDEIKSSIAKAPDDAKKKLTEEATKLKAKETELNKREDKLREKEIDKKVYADKLYYLKIKEYLEYGHYNNDMYMIDANTRTVMFKSPVKNIAGRKYDVFSNGVVVITHLGNDRSGHRLTMLDRETLKAIKVGSDNIFWRSFIIIKDNHIYAILKEKNKYFLGRFNKELKMVAKSDVYVAEDTFISIYGNYIYINSEQKEIMVLKKKNLSLLELVKTK